jgi:hypothetical protein
MKTLNLVYIDSISGKSIKSIEDIIRDERLIKHLWIEVILNPEVVLNLKSYTDDANIRNVLTDALSWYLAFRWIFPENAALEELQKSRLITPYRISNMIYRQNNRNFLKGLLHAGLC